MNLLEKYKAMSNEARLERIERTLASHPWLDEWFKKNGYPNAFKDGGAFLVIAKQLGRIDYIEDRVKSLEEKGCLQKARELRSCPFCGGAPLDLQFKESERARVECLTCGAVMFSRTGVLAREEWNRRV